MRIIRKGANRIPLAERMAWEGRWLCETCDSAIEFGPKDGRQYLASIGTDKLHAICPVCGKARTFVRLNGDNGEPGDYK